SAGCIDAIVSQRKCKLDPPPLDGHGDGDVLSTGRGEIVTQRREQQIRAPFGARDHVLSDPQPLRELYLREFARLANRGEIHRVDAILFGHPVEDLLDGRCTRRLVCVPTQPSVAPPIGLSLTHLSLFSWMKRS